MYIGVFCYKTFLPFQNIYKHVKIHLLTLLALRKAKIVYNLSVSVCNRVKTEVNFRDCFGRENNPIEDFQKTALYV